MTAPEPPRIGPYPDVHYSEQALVNARYADWHRRRADIAELRIRGFEAIKESLERDLNLKRAERDEARALLREYGHEGRLQTFEDRERFRARIAALLLGEKL